MWSRYQLYEELLVALGDLYGRVRSFNLPIFLSIIYSTTQGELLRPHEYHHLDSSPIHLLSRIYEHLSHHFNRQSSLLTRSIMAFILSTASHDYIKQTALSVGFGGQRKTKSTQSTSARTDVSDGFGDEEEQEEDIFDVLDSIETAFPSFFPQDVVDLLPAAQKSLLLLKVAQPEHPMLNSGSGGSIKADVRWLWTAKEVEAAWNQHHLSPGSSPSCLPNSSALPQQTKVIYKPELSEFCIFDLEPGIGSSGILGHPSSAKDTAGIPSSTSVLKNFVSSFPPSLPPITPTLPTLASLTFHPLSQHASTLSRTLLEIFLKQPGMLNFQTHLVLMKNFLLVAKPDFKARLVVALFDDAGEFAIGSSSAHAMSVRAIIRRQKEGYAVNVVQHSKRTQCKQGQEGGWEKSDEPENEKLSPWAVGLAPHLFERGTWPPVGSDLSFFLRTVIMDSLDWRDNKDGIKRDDTVVLEEAEWRLGFAIKDLPVGKRGEKWLNPLCVYIILLIFV